MKNSLLVILACGLLCTAFSDGYNHWFTGGRAFLGLKEEGKRPDQVKGKFKIPLEADRWYQLNYTTNGLQGLFDGRLDQEVEKNYGKVLHTFEAVYPLQPDEEMTIEHVLFYDGEGVREKAPFTLSVITDTWERIVIATFTGSRYKAWVGPDAEQSDFRLPIPIVNPRYLVISTPSFYPTEMEIYGTYKPGKPLANVNVDSIASRKSVKFKQTTGINAFEWDFEAPAHPMVIDEVRWQAIKPFSGVRHYMDWEKIEPQEGQYTFNPTHAGGWNYDTIYERCKAEGVEVLACLKTLPKWMIETYPQDQRDYENVPVRYGRDFSDPASYIEQARAAFQFAARYGSNRNLDTALVKVSKKTRWTGDKVNEVKIGLGLIRYMENENERDKWWKGRKAYQTGREYAANLSAFYDGHKNTLGPAVGVKNADPTMQVVMAGLAHPSIDYIMGMVDWCKEFRGYRPDGTVDLCWDVINYHLYSNDAGTSQGRQPTRGAAPEVSNAAMVARNFIRFAHQYTQGMPVWITETGYDLHQGSPFKAIPIGKKSAALTQADWILRSSLLYARHGVERVFFYQLVDDNSESPGQFSTSGLINQDRSRRPAADYLYQVNKMFGEYRFQETIHQDPMVDRYELEGKSMYVLFVPGEQDRKANVTLDLGEAAAAFIYQPQAGQDEMLKKKLSTVNGKLTIPVSETPVFVSAAPVVK